MTGTLAGVYLGRLLRVPGLPALLRVPGFRLRRDASQFAAKYALSKNVKAKIKFFQSLITQSFSVCVSLDSLQRQ